MTWLAHLWHWVEVHTGTVNEGGPYYGFWSGFGSDIGEVVLIGAVVGAFRTRNCHHKGCFRLSHHITAKGYRLCKKHAAMPEEDLDLHEINPDHLVGA